MFLRGKTALVTGSTSGIGLGIAEHLASEGANVIVNGFGEARAIRKMCDEMAARNEVAVRYDGADLGEQRAIEDLMAGGLAEFGCIDVVVNNAGVQHVAPLEEFPVQKWDAILAVNLTAAFHITRLALPAMRERGWGRVVNIASAHALVASPFKAAYVAAKHGIAGFTKTVALETAEHGVTVNAVCPGYVLTPLVERQIPETARARGISEEAVVRDVLLAAQPTRRFITVEEVAALTCFLCRPEADSITGAIIPIDGGWTAH